MGLNTIGIRCKIYPALPGILVIFLLLVSGCASVGENEGLGSFSETERLKKVAPQSPVPRERRTTSNQEKEEKKAQERATPENPQHPEGMETLKSTSWKSSVLNTPPQTGISRRPEGRKEKLVEEKSVHVELAFDNADLYEVLDATLYELFKVNYMMDPSIKAKVTFHISGDYTRIQFVNLLNNVLQLDKIAIVKGPGDIFKIVRRPMSAGAVNAPLVTGGEIGVGDITRMIRLRYLSAAAAIGNVRPFLSTGAVLTQNTMNNSLVITDTPDNVAKAVSILGALDVPYFNDISWQLFPVKEVDASDMAKDLKTVFTTGGLYNRPGIDKGAFQIMPLETMNALLVVSRWPSILTLVERWVKMMDHADDSGINVYVYFVENGSAVELTDILKQVYGGTSGKKSQKTAIVKPVSKETIGSGSGELIGDVEIIPDETNNAIVFKASGRDYNLIKSVLKQLDIIPRQVLIEVTVAEITLSESVQYGVEWFLQGHSDGYTFQGALDENVGRTIDTPLGSVSGFTYAVYDKVDFMRTLIHALGEDSDVNILSSPNILAVDNKEASIEVGEEVPTVTGQVTDATSGTTVTNTIQYRKTGIILSVTPHINSSGLVKMEVSQEVSEKGEFNTTLSSYTFLNRKASTSLVVEDGQTILIGGLMKSNRNTSGAGIPFLRKIPLLGYLFGGIVKEVKKTELILLITPHVITNRTQADFITKEFSQKVQGLKKLTEKGKH